MTQHSFAIVGAGSSNRGAELMAIAVAAELRARYPHSRIAVPFRNWSFEARQRHGFYVMDSARASLRSRTLFSVAAAASGFELGVLPNEEISAFIDVSGFALGDTWGAKRSRRFLKGMTRRAVRNRPLILMPQAFGPFTDDAVRHWASAIFHRASIAYARDRSSFELARPLAPAARLQMGPDFTIAVPPLAVDNIVLPEHFVAVVPNSRMLDKHDPARYLRWLSQCVQALSARSLHPVFVLHDEVEDLRLIERLEGECSGIPVLQHHSPQTLKWILGRARAVVSSRFHALVGALCQGVPSFAVGWSHKYMHLMEDFGFPEGILGDPASESDILRLCQSCEDAGQLAAYRIQIEAAAAVQKERLAAMWKGAHEAIGLEHAA